MASLDTAAKAFLDQPRIAVVGVSVRRPEQTANYIYKTIKAAGKQVFPVTPNATEFEGDKCYTAVSAIPDGVDGVVIVTRPEITEMVVEDCAKAGIKRVWMHSNGMGPSSASDKAIAYCNQHGIEVIGGACPMMYLEFGHKCMRVVLNMMGKLPKETGRAAPAN
jgi:predicted CoA-binding protein